MQNYNLKICPIESQNLISQSTYNKLLGKGANGIVYEISYRNRIAALKIAIPGKEESLRNELVIYKYLCKIFEQCYCEMNIVQMLGYSDQIPFIVLEYFDGADLTSCLNYPVSNITYHTHRLMKRQFPDDANYELLGYYLKLDYREDIIFKLFKNIFEGISCLHYRGVLHKDFELKNILIRSDGKIAITDFGTSQIIQFDSYYYLMAGFAVDLDKLGPMLGNFIDSKNDIPFQLLLDQTSKFSRKNDEERDIRHLLSTISSSHLQDMFLLFMNFPSILSFISFVKYCNWNLDDKITNQLIYEAADIYNDNIEVDGPPDENEKDLITIFEVDIDYVINNIHEYINTYDLTMLSLNYFRSIIDSLILTLNLTLLLPTESVYNGIIRIFGKDQYKIIIKTFQELISDFGFLIKNFNIFENTFMV
jgi:serine/threonine protein kinase